MSNLTKHQKELADLLLKTKIEAKVIRRHQRKNGSYYLEEAKRLTSPIDFAKVEGEFALKVHEKNPSAPLSPIYVNLRNLPENVLEKIGQVLAETPLDAPQDYCSGVPKAAVVIAQKYAQVKGTSFMDVFEKIGADTNRKIVIKKGVKPKKGTRLLVIDDVVAHGKSKLEALEAAKKVGFYVNMLVLIDREQGGMEQVKDEGCSIYASMKLTDILEYYFEKKMISKKQYEASINYLKPSKLIKLPGLIDPHVHFRTPGQSYKEDFQSGTKAAIAGGITTVLDMPNNATPITTIKLLKEKQKEAKGKVYADLGFHFGSLGEDLGELKKANKHVYGLKIYLNQTTGGFIVTETKFTQICKEWPKGKPILVHAEEDVIANILKIGNQTKQKIHVCHVSSKKELQIIIKAKKAGLPAARLPAGQGRQVTCGVTPHHLFLTDSDAKKLGAFGKMKPFLKSKEDVDFLWKNIQYIDLIETDHAPHTLEEKKSENPPFGVPGLETSLSLMLTAVNEGKITLKEVKRLMHDGPKKIFKIKTDPKTYIEVDLNEEWVVEGKKLYTKCKWSPFEGKKLKGRVKTVYLRGKKVFDQGRVLEKPSGKII